ncbi:hypothetical protein EDB87DRAFT_1580437 [Lactarius vividus]|nr:hypothetical protein EDB87DRAFT_1580437 [Lactarius vividus]
MTKYATAIPEDDTDPAEPLLFREGKEIYLRSPIYASSSLGDVPNGTGYVYDASASAGTQTPSAVSLRRDLALVSLFWTRTTITSPRLCAKPLDSCPEDRVARDTIRCRGRQQPTEGVKTLLNPLEPPCSPSASYFSLRATSSPANNYDIETYVQAVNTRRFTRTPKIAIAAVEANRTRTSCTLSSSTTTSLRAPRLILRRCIFEKRNKKTENLQEGSRDASWQEKGFEQLKSNSDLRTIFPIDSWLADSNLSAPPTPVLIIKLVTEDCTMVLHVPVAGVIYPESKHLYTLSMNPDTTYLWTTTDRSKLGTQIPNDHPIEPPSPLSTQRSQLVTVTKDSITTSSHIIEPKTERQRLDKSEDSETDTTESTSHDRVNKAAVNVYADIAVTPGVRYKDSSALRHVTANAVSPSNTNSRLQSYDETSRVTRCLYCNKAYMLRAIPCPHCNCGCIDHYYMTVRHPDFVDPCTHRLPSIISAAQSPFSRSLPPSDSARSNVFARTLPLSLQNSRNICNFSVTDLTHSRAFPIRHTLHHIPDPASSPRHRSSNIPPELPGDHSYPYDTNRRTEVVTLSIVRGRASLVRGLCHDHVTCDVAREKFGLTPGLTARQNAGNCQNAYTFSWFA